MSVQWTSESKGGGWRVVEITGGGRGRGQRLMSGECTEETARKLAGLTKRALWEKGWREGRGDGRMWLGREWVEIRVVEE